MCFKLSTFVVFNVFLMIRTPFKCLINMPILILHKNSQLLLSLYASWMTILKSKFYFGIVVILDFELLNFTNLVKKSHCGPGEGVRKVPKKFHVLFEWPLTILKLYSSIVQNLDCFFGFKIFVSTKQTCFRLTTN